MISITPTLELDEKNLEFSFVRSSGPGGQNVNKVSTAVQLRFDPSSLPEDVHGRLVRLAGSRMTSAGILMIMAQRYRTQEKNKRDALERLVKLVRQAAVKPRKRRKTAPTRASHLRRLEKKRRRSETKRQRRSPHSFE